MGELLSRSDAEPIAPQSDYAEVPLLPSHVRLLELTDRMFEVMGDQGQGIFFQDSGSENILQKVKDASFGDVLVKGELQSDSLQPGIAVSCYGREHQQYKKDLENPGKFKEIPGAVFKGRLISIYFSYGDDVKNESHSITLENIASGTGPLTLIGVNISTDSSVGEESDRRDDNVRSVASEDEALAFIDLVDGIFQTWKNINFPEVSQSTSETTAE